MDKYTKVVLTLIAFALWANLLVSLAPAGRGLIRNANAYSVGTMPTPVVIVGVDTTGGATYGLNAAAALPVQVAASQPAPVYLTPGPNAANPMVLPVNLAQIGARSFQQGVALPVDIEGIAGTAVKSSSGLPVAALQPLAVAAKDPLQVTVVKMPPVVIPSPQSTAGGYSTSPNPGTQPPPGN